MQVTPTILAAQRVQIGEAQIIEWRWPTPLDVTVCEDRHMIEMSLPPFATDAVATFPDVAPGGRVRFGRLFVRPAGVLIRSCGVGGHNRVVRLAIEPGACEALTGEAFPIEEGRLRAGLDLRDRGVRWLIGRLRDELESPGFGHAALIEAYAVSLAIEAARAIAGSGKTRQEEGQLAGWQARRVHERLAAEGPPPSVRELAGLCGVSTRHFARLYSGQAGMAASAHIAEVQVDRAKRLLGDSDLPMKEIAARLGFACAGSFSSAFRRATGRTPSDFRRHSRIH